VMRRRLAESFRQWAQEYKDDPLRLDASIRAQRVHRLLEAVSDVGEEEEMAIPATSHLREFIGGSCYEY
jgi:uridine kinase